MLNYGRHPPSLSSGKALSVGPGGNPADGAHGLVDGTTVAQDIHLAHMFGRQIARVVGGGFGRRRTVRPRAVA